MLCWKIWNEAKALGCRPSDLYNVEWPLARFYFDRGIYWWGNFVEQKLNEAENNVRSQMKNSKGVESFATSARIVMFNRIFGLSTASAYRQPDLPGLKKETKEIESPKVTDLSGFNG